LKQGLLSGVLKQALDKGIDFKVSANSKHDVVDYKDQEQIKDELY